MDKYEVRMQLNEDLVRLKKQQAESSHASEDMRFQLLWQRVGEAEAKSAAVQDSILALERTFSVRAQMDDEKFGGLKRLAVQQTATWKDASEQQLRRLTEVNQSSYQLNEAMRQLQSDFEASRAEVAVLARKFKAGSGLRHALSAKVQELEAVLDRVNRENVELRAWRNGLHQQLGSLAAREDLAVLARKHEELHAHCQQQAQELSEVHSRAVHAVEGLQAVQASLEAARGEREEADAQLQKAVSAIAGVQAQLALSGHALEQLPDDISRLRQGEERLLSAVSEMRGSVRARESEAVVFARSLDTLQTTLEEDRRLGARNDSAVQTLTAEVRQLKQRFTVALRFLNDAAGANPSIAPAADIGTSASASGALNMNAGGGARGATTRAGQGLDFQPQQQPQPRPFSALTPGRVPPGPGPGLAAATATNLAPMLRAGDIDWHLSQAELERRTPLSASRPRLSGSFASSQQGHTNTSDYGSRPAAGRSHAPGLSDFRAGHEPTGTGSGSGLGPPVTPGLGRRVAFASPPTLSQRNGSDGSSSSSYRRAMGVPGPALRPHATIAARSPGNWA